MNVIFHEIDANARERVNAFIQNFDLNNSYKFYTSGTTGIPKEIRISGKQMWLSAQKTISYLQLNSTHKALICLDTRYIAGTMMIVRCLAANMDMLITAPRANPLSVTFPYLTDFAAFVPLQLSEMCQDGYIPEYLNSMKCVLIGGDGISTTLATLCTNMQPDVYHTYGMTETVSHIAMRRLNGADISDVYTPLPDVEINTDQRGCLIVKADVTNHEWVVTNDVVSMVGQNFIINGRIDHVIVSGAYKIHPEVVENTVYMAAKEWNIPMLCLCKGIDDEKYGKKCVLYIQKSSVLNYELIPKILLYLQSKLHKYEVPKEIIFTDNIALNAAGKVLRYGE
ncbi:MAG: AMP-binding protein [Cytophagales bacterium]|nr:AMP-binding protein [Cytophagales bacterium]